MNTAGVVLLVLGIVLIVAGLLRSEGVNSSDDFTYFGMIFIGAACALAGVALLALRLISGS